MVKLVKMQQEDFEPYLERGIREYAEDHVRNGNWTAEESLERSRKEFQELLPDGVNSRDQFLYSIVGEENNNEIGLLWVQIKDQKAFIYDFIIDESFRGKGYGKQALTAMDEILKSMNVESVSLHVFGDNVTAQELYRKMGFEITGMHMKKRFNP
ncbi:MAG: GNAT family N-acetyltransferase [Chloroflexota bacterium]